MIEFSLLKMRCLELRLHARYFGFLPWRWRALDARRRRGEQQRVVQVGAEVGPLLQGGAVAGLCGGWRKRERESELFKT